MNCFLCEKGAISERETLKDNQFIVCESCGRYEISSMLIAMWTLEERQQKAHILSGLCRELLETSQPAPVLQIANVSDLLSKFPVPNMGDIDAKLEKLLTAVHRKSFDEFGEIVELHRHKDYPLAYAKNGEEFFAFVDQLIESGLLKLRGEDSQTKHVSLTMKGWNHFSGVGGERKPYQVFVAASANPECTDNVNAIKSAIEACKLSPVWIIGEHFQQTIMEKALGELRRSAFAVIDLTGGSKNVFYEAGFAKALNIDVIFVYRTGEVDRPSELAFYVRHYSCREYTTPEELKEIVINAIRARR